MSEVEVAGAIERTWREVREREARGQARWGGPGGEEGFWRRFAGRVFAACGGGELPDGCFGELRGHFARPVHWAVYPEVPGVLSTLRSRGLALGVVSNWDSTLPDLLASVSLAPYFDAVVSSAEFGASKPSPAIFAEALTRLGVPAGAALHVGDSLEEDYHAARAAGLAALLLDRSGRAGGGVPTISTLAGIESLLST